MTLGGWIVGGGSQARSQSRTPLIRVPLHFVVVSDDDGGRPARYDPEALHAWVDFANRTFSTAGIRFDFSPLYDISTVRSTLLNDLGAPPVPDWATKKAVGDRVAAEHPGELVVLVRHGPGDRPAGNAFAGTDHAFVVMPGTEDARHCGHPHTDALAHEIGHYLALPHTFPGEPFPDLAAAEAFLAEPGRDPAFFDGDGFSDTPPDPAIRELECPRVESVTLTGVQYRLPRRNIMAYYDERDGLSPQQAERARWMLQQRLAFPPTMRPVNRTGPGAVEAEGMEVEATRGVSPSIQPLEGYGVDDWSGNAQLFVGSGGDGEITLRFRLEATWSRPVLYASQAPDFARIQVLLDGEPSGDPIDLYAPIVLPTGAIPLGRLTLRPGEHRLTIRVEGKNPASTGHHFGIDALDRQGGG